jgi:hypothetical protein
MHAGAVHWLHGHAVRDIAVEAIVVLHGGLVVRVVASIVVP